MTRMPEPSASHSAPLPQTGNGVHVQQVTLQRGRTQVFDALDLHLTERRIALIGDNGAGKTSLLRLLCGLETPASGQVCFDGAPLASAGSERARWVGLMFQNPEDQIIYPVVEEEIALSFRSRGMAKRPALEAARQLLTERGAGEWAGRAIGNLSQGQRQQVCWLALAAAAPRVLLLDEPFASLDLPSQHRLGDDIADAPQQVLLSTHVLTHIQHFDRVIWLDRGRIRADGAPAQVCTDYANDVAARTAARREHRMASHG